MDRRDFMIGSMALVGQSQLIRGMTSAPMAGAETASKYPPQNLLATTYPQLFLENNLVGLGQWHPYPKWSEREAWESIPADLRGAYIAKAEADQREGWKPILASTFLDFKRNGNRTRYEADTFGRRARLMRFVLAECIEGKGRFVDEIVNGVWLICEETFWGIPASQGTQRAGLGLPDVTEPIIELFAACTAQLMAWTYYLVGEQLDSVSPLITKRIVLETEQRILTPARDRDDFWWMGFKSNGARMNNWTPWINSNLLVANLILEQDAKLRVREITRITRSLDIFLNQYWPDGGEEEGAGYFSVSPMCYFECVSMLESSTGNTTGIFSNPFFGMMGRYILNAHVADDNYINYGDAHIHAAPDGDLLYRYGKAIHDEELMGFGAYCAARNGWTSTGDGLKGVLNASLVFLGRSMPAVLGANEIRNAKKEEGLRRDSYYPSLGLATARIKDGSPSGMYFAALAANNGRSHSHNDTGSYILYLDGKPVAIDVGVEAYSAQTFGPDRYKLWTMQSAYHNLPTIGGVEQKNGASFKAADLHFDSNDRRAMFSFDIAGAYPAEAGVKKWVRTLTLDRVRGTVTIDEDFELERAVPVTLSLMTQCTADTGIDGCVSLSLPTANARACVMKYDAQALEPKVQTIRLEDEGLRENWGDLIYRILLDAKQPVTRGKWSYEFGAA